MGVQVLNVKRVFVGRIRSRFIRRVNQIRLMKKRVFIGLIRNHKTRVGRIKAYRKVK